ncbi:MAG: hypothetical protein KBD78_05630 [Oligoflexales bacterium]|nr:hypothetical protein [Oligoflexales bacterium]
MLRRALVTLGLFVASQGLAHDEGHGPKLKDPAKRGGKLAPVIAHNEISKGTKATMLYKAEFTKNAENLVRVYLYDEKMAPKTLAIKGASGTIYYKDKAKNKMAEIPVSMKVENGEITASLPADIGKPFDLDVTLETEDKKLFIAFDGNR